MSAPVRRAVLLDLETTGLNPEVGDRVVEIAAIEWHNDAPTGRDFHRLIHPERDIPLTVSRIHGIAMIHVLDAPTFGEVASDLLAFLGDGPLIAHNAPFDFGFLNAELARLSRPPLDRTRGVDTLALARARFPRQQNSLDALCRRFKIGLAQRTTHNALGDCQLLAKVYVELRDGLQSRLTLPDSAHGATKAPEQPGGPSRDLTTRGSLSTD